MDRDFIEEVLWECLDGLASSGYTDYFSFYDLVAMIPLPQLEVRPVVANVLEVAMKHHLVTCVGSSFLYLLRFKFTDKALKGGWGHDPAADHA